MIAGLLVAAGYGRRFDPTGARQVLMRHPPLRIPVDDVGVVRDIDTPADLSPASDSTPP